MPKNDPAAQEEAARTDAGAVNANLDAVGPVVGNNAENPQPLKHSRGGITTRDDANDHGVPMLPGDPSEPVGPEDALGQGPTRGDYRERLGYHSRTVPHEALPVPDAEPGQPKVKLDPQGPRLNEIGEVPGKKGGVNSAA